MVLLGLIAPGTASAAEIGYWKRVNDGEFNAYQWYEGAAPGGTATDRFMSEKTMAATATRMAAGWTYDNRGAGYTTAEISEGSKVLTAIKTAATTAGTAATLNTIKGEGLSLMARMRAYGALRTLGDVGLAVTAFQVGYSIGGKIASFLGFENGSGEVEEKVATQYHASSVSPYAAGETYCEGSGCSGGSLGGPAPFAVPTWVVKWTPNTSGSSRSDLLAPAQGGSVSGCEALWTGVNAPPGSVRGEYEWLSACGSEGGENFHQLTTMPMQVKCLPEEPGCSPKETRKGEAMPKAMTEEEAEPKARECLEGVGCRLMPGMWWAHDPEQREGTTRRYGDGVDLEPANPLQVRVPTPGRHENYVTYDKRLEKLELKPEAIALPEEFANPSYGPEEVTQVNPAPSTQLEPGTVVKVRYNPATATKNTPSQETETAPSGGGPWSPPSVPSINMEPLSGFKPCGVFPFGLFCWMGEAFGQFNTSGTCPKAAVPVASTHFELSLCGESSEQVMSIARPAILLIFIVGCGVMFARGTKAIGDD